MSNFLILSPDPCQGHVVLGVKLYDGPQGLFVTSPTPMFSPSPLLKNYLHSQRAWENSRTQYWSDQPVSEFLSVPQQIFCKVRPRISRYFEAFEITLNRTCLVTPRAQAAKETKSRNTHVYCDSLNLDPGFDKFGHFGICIGSIDIIRGLESPGGQTRMDTTKYLPNSDAVIIQDCKPPPASPLLARTLILFIGAGFQNTMAPSILLAD